MKSKLNINIGIILHTMKIFHISQNMNAFGRQSQFGIIFSTRPRKMIFMVLEYCLLSRRRHYMISESYFLLLISHLPNIFIPKKRENFPPSGHFASSDSDRSFQTKKSVRG